MKSYRFSYSAVKDFLDCPLRMQYRLYGRERKNPPPIVLVGTYCHKFIQRYIKHCIEAERRQDMAEYQKIKNIVYLDSLNMRSTPLSSEDWDMNAYGLLFPWVSRFEVPIENVLGIEMQLAVNRNGAKTGWDVAYLRGILDLVVRVDDAHIKVIDFKTGYNRADSIQADMYAYLVWSFWADVEEITVEFHYLRMNDTEEFCYTNQEIEGIERNIHELLEYILNIEKFEPRPGLACEGCPYEHCCNYKVDITLSVLNNDEEARVALDQIANLDREKRSLTRLLKHYCEQNLRSVISNGKEAGYFPVKQEGFHNPKDFVERLSGDGQDPWPWVTVDNLRSRKFRRMYPDLVSTKDKGSAFKIKNNKEDE